MSNLRNILNYFLAVKKIDVHGGRSFTYDQKEKKSAIIGLIDMLFAYFSENVISSQFEIRKKYVYFF